MCTCAHRRSHLRLCLGGGGGLICAYICSFPPTASVYVCVRHCWTPLWCSSRTYLFSGLGAPNSVAAKVRSAAVPVNDVWEERGADKDSYCSAHRRGLTFDAHVHTHTHTRMHTHTEACTRLDTPRLTGPGLSPVKRSDCHLMFIHRQRHPSSAATYYCHPRIYTAELKGSPAWRPGERLQWLFACR